MTYSGCERWMKEQLPAIYDTGEAALIADWIMEHFTGYGRQERRLAAGQPLPEEVLASIRQAMAALMQHKPLQYVLGHAFFYHLKLAVDEAVLIPRPETEELVAWIISDCRQQPGLTLLDVGTGSGCIAIALQQNLQQAHVTAIDVSEAALAVAGRNARSNEAAILFQQLDFLDEASWDFLPLYHFLVSNPPYIPNREKAGMDRNVRDWEPGTALFVPDEAPLLFYEKIARFGQRHLLPGGRIYLETHRDHAAAVEQLFIANGYSAERRKDMHGNERMVKAVRTGSSAASNTQQPAQIHEHPAPVRIQVG